MESEDRKLFRFLGTLGTLAFVSIASSCAVDRHYKAVENHDDNTAAAEMVKAGAHPLDAACAINRGHASQCAIRASLSQGEG